MGLRLWYYMLPAGRPNRWNRLLSTLVVSTVRSMLGRRGVVVPMYIRVRGVTVVVMSLQARRNLLSFFRYKLSWRG